MVQEQISAMKRRTISMQAGKIIWQICIIGQKYRDKWMLNVNIDNEDEFRDIAASVKPLVLEFEGAYKRAAAEKGEEAELCGSIRIALKKDMTSKDDILGIIYLVIDESEKRLTIERKRIFLDERIVSLENTLEKKMRKADIGGLPKNFTDEEEIEKRIFRNAVTRAVYTALSEKTGQKLPWGTLTGIRPTKQILWCLAAGNAERTVKEYYRKNYLLSEEKLELALTVAKNENNLLTVKGNQSYFNNGFSLYIDIPFCPSTCYYCSFTSYPVAASGQFIEPYLNALFREIDEVSDYIYGRSNASTNVENDMNISIMKGKRLDSVYIGGGTPTTLSAEQLDRLITKIEQKFDLSEILEFTVEAGRPDTITRDKLEALKKHGVDRISINPQSMNQETLDIIGRRHTVEDIIKTYKTARELGFDNINMDIIIGLANETPKEVAHTVEEIKKLAPDDFTVHSLAIKRAAKLNTAKKFYADLQATEIEEAERISYEAAKEMGLEPYYMYRQKNMAGNNENVGYAKPGKYGVYNVLIMEERQSILALGCGASTKLVYPENGRIERIENVKSLMDYIGRTDEMVARKLGYR